MGVPCPPRVLRDSREKLGKVALDPEPVHLPNFITVCFLVSWKYCPCSLLHQPNLELSLISSFTHRHAHTNTTYWRRPLCEHLSLPTRIEWLVLTHDLSCPNSSIKEENFFLYQAQTVQVCLSIMQLIPLINFLESVYLFPFHNHP